MSIRGTESQIENKAKVSADPELYSLIQSKDSLLFEAGFNHGDTAVVAPLISDDFEFYHDLHGVMQSKSEFLSSIQGIRELPFKVWRTLQANSLHVYPLYEDGKLYGAIEVGVHDFFEQYEGADAKKTSTALFTHVWILEKEEWKLKRVLSYNHIQEEDER